jgi:hypothetical protein
VANGSKMRDGREEKEGDTEKRRKIKIFRKINDGIFPAHLVVDGKLSFLLFGDDWLGFPGNPHRFQTKLPVGVYQSVAMDSITQFLLPPCTFSRLQYIFFL